MLYLQMFYEFFKTGLFAVGGGLATIPFLYNMAERFGWFSREDIANMLAVSESTPGPIGVNMATYVGFVSGSANGLLSGILGGVLTTLGLVTPSIIIILIVAKFLKSFGESRIVKSVFYGLRPASVGLIAAAGIAVAGEVFLVPAFKETRAFADLLDWRALALAAVLIVLTRFVKQTKKLHPIIFIAFSAVVGVIFAF